MLGRKAPLKTFGGRGDTPAGSPPLASRPAAPAAFPDRDAELQARINDFMAGEAAPHTAARKRPPVNKHKQEMEDEGIFSSSDDDSTPARRPVRSIHELVEAGEHSRLLDEVEYLVEGLREGSDRSRLLCLDDLLAKVSEPEGGALGRRMRAHGLLARAADALVGLAARHPRAAAGVCCLLMVLCQDTRRLDAFVSAAHQLAVAGLLLQHPAEAYAYAAHVRARGPFKDTLRAADTLTNRPAGLWLLAKLVQGAPGPAAARELAALCAAAGADAAAAAALDALLAAGLHSPFECLQARWALLVLALFPDRLAPPHGRPLIAAAQGALALGGEQGPLALLALSQALVRLSGPDADAAALAADASFTAGLLAALRAVLPDEARAPEPAVCLLSTLINLADRSEALRESLRFQGDFLDACARHYAGAGVPEVKQYLGLLLGLVSLDNVSNQRIVRLPPPAPRPLTPAALGLPARPAAGPHRQPGAARAGLRPGTRPAPGPRRPVQWPGAQCPEIARRAHKNIPRVSHVHQPGQPSATRPPHHMRALGTLGLLLALLWHALLVRAQCQSVLTIWRTTTTIESATLVTTVTRTSTVITTTTLETTRTRNTTSTATTTSSIFTTRTLSTTSQFTTFITTTTTQTRTTLVYITETVSTTRTLTRTTQFTETATDSTLVVRSTRQILSGTITNTGTRTTRIQVTKYRSIPRTSTTQVTRYFPATRTIFSTRVTTISLTITGSFTATDLISNAGSGLSDARLSPLAKAGMALGLLVPYFLL